MMQIIGANKNFDIAVDLVGSKSESNRALMIGYYGGFKPRVKNLSASDDTVLLKNILDSIAQDNTAIIDCQNAGTVLRFLATALSLRARDCVLTGSARMLQRPVAELVDTLRAMGADIEYMGHEGFPPLKINGKNIVKARTSQPIHIDISRSSQFASSILLAMPTVETGRCPSPNVDETDSGPSLHLDGDLSSLPYIDMTIDIMRKFGIDVHRNGRDVLVQPSQYHDVEYTVESDWTCASYWYEMVALSDNGRARLRNLHLDSKQGDAIVAKWFENFGVTSVQKGDDIVIEKHINEGVKMPQNVSKRVLELDFIDNPDLYPTIAATCAGLGLEGRFTGLRNLIHKESDRVAAMTAELAKLNSYGSQPIVFDSHDDHRIAMSLAPLAMKIGAIEINNAEVVSKSYPNFWKEMSLL